MRFVPGPPLFAQQPERQSARAIFKELIEINTTASVWDTTLPQVLVRTPKTGNLVVRLRGTGTAKTVSQNPGDTAAVNRLSALPVYNSQLRTPASPQCLPAETRKAHCRKAQRRSSTAACLRAITGETHVRDSHRRPRSIGPAYPSSLR